MKNSLYLSLFLLACIEVLLIIYIDYAELIHPSSPFYDFQLPAIPLFVPLCAIVVCLFTKDSKFHWLTFKVLVPVSLLLGLVLLYFVGLGHSNH